MKKYNEQNGGKTLCPWKTKETVPYPHPGRIKPSLPSLQVEKF